MVALITSLLVLAGLLGVAVVVSKRRPPGTPLTWGEAMVAALYTFFLFLWVYAIIPHLVLQYTDNELRWRPDVLTYKYWGFLGFLKPTTQGGWFPITISMQTVRDILIVVIYVIFLGLNIFLWAWWNERGKRAEAAEAELATSDYGRPLVRKG